MKKTGTEKKRVRRGGGSGNRNGNDFEDSKVSSNVFTCTVFHLLSSICFFLFVICYVVRRSHFQFFAALEQYIYLLRY